MLWVAVQHPSPHTHRPTGGCRDRIEYLTAGLYRCRGIARALGPRDHMIGYVTIPGRSGVGGAHTNDSLAETCGHLGNGRPAASPLYIIMEYAPLLCVNAAGPALPEGLGFLLIARLLLNLKRYSLMK